MSRQSTDTSWALAAGNPPDTILNDFYSNARPKVEETSEFTCFPRLPAELQYAIWQEALQQSRYIDVSLTALDQNTQVIPAEVGSKGKCAKAMPEPSVSYNLQIKTRHRNHPALSTSRAARDAALAFYRVQLPYRTPHAPGVRYLYLNPRLDVLHVEANMDPELFVELLADIKVHDAKSVGLRHLSIGSLNLGTLRLPSNPSCHSVEKREGFRDAIKRLDQVYFRDIVHTEARQMFNSLRLEEVLFNRSFPIWAQSEEFKLLDADPRSISEDLEKVCLGCDPRGMLYAWQEMERAFEIDCSTEGPRKSYIITAPVSCSGEWPTVASRHDVARALKIEADFWKWSWEPEQIYAQVSYPHPDTPEKLARSPLPAVGFWLWPIEALGAPQDMYRRKAEGKFENVHWHQCQLMNLSSCPPPKLGVFNLNVSD